MNWNQLLPTHHSLAPSKDGIPPRNDYDTIICSTLFRRLQDKAQVFPLDDDDYIRTRLTHSLEVSAIGKRLGEYVFGRLKAGKMDPWFEEHPEQAFTDVLLCAGLIHDIGNPPFGHFGEYAIREWFEKNLGELFLEGHRVTELLTKWQLQDLYLFEGNAQSLRLLSKTPYLGEMNGFGLSCETLGAIIKYPVSSEKLLPGGRVKYKKYGYHFSERRLFDQINRSLGMEGKRHPLSWLLEAADYIAYRTSDLEDAVVKKVISLSQILESFGQYRKKHCRGTEDAAGECMDRLEAVYREETGKNGRKPELTAIQRWNQWVQAMMIRDAGDAFVENYHSIMEGTYEGDLLEHRTSGHLVRAIGELSERLIYTSSLKTRTELFGRRVIDSLLGQFMPAAILYDTGTPMTLIEARTIDTVSEFYKSMYARESEGKDEQEKLYLRILMITDYISGMTDNYAKKLYRELFV